jgi:hypothetical protein
MTVFVLRLTARPGVDGIKALRLALKYFQRQCGLRCLSAQEAQENAGRTEADDEQVQKAG